ncbi:MAG TPA: hypothetical protein VFM93_00100 [Candidatus Limnocylindria bacterium]|nr:hypothetical protein [Candidatus Limnocylindria bacterium]
MDAAGGRCVDCGYATTLAALEFHHRDAAQKEFALGGYSGGIERLRAEAAKCDLLCASCHRMRHAALDAGRAGGSVVEHRRRRKARAIRYMGASCETCWTTGPDAIFEFHHRDPAEKEFGVSEDGIPRSWEKVLAELAKCVMLCANCHREVHAGVRDLEPVLLGLAEPAAPYGLRAA